MRLLHENNIYGRVNYITIIAAVVMMFALLFINSTFVLLTVSLYLIGITSLLVCSSLKEIKIFSGFFWFYTVCMLLTHYYSLYNLGEVGLYKDETTFFTLAEFASTKISQGNGIGYFATTYDFHKFPLFIYLNGLIYSFSDKFSDVSQINHKIPIVFYCSLIPVFVYKIISEFTNENRATVASLLFGFGCFLPYFTTIYIRDMQVAFLYAWFFTVFVTCRIFSLQLFLLLFISFLTFYTRNENGVYLGAILSGYLFFLLSEKITSRTLKASLIVFMCIGAVFIAANLGILERVSEIYLSTSKHAETHAHSSSLSMALGNLPFGIGYPFIVLFTQIQPFPVSLYLSEPDQVLIRITYVISGFVWFYIITMLVTALSHDSTLSKLSIRLKYLFYACLPYLVIIGSTEGVTRRLFPVYIIIFVCSFLLNEDKSKDYKIRMFVIVVMIILFLNLFYYILKL